MQKHDSLINRVRQQIEKNYLFKRKERILVACSGGADSVVMLEVLRVLAPAFGWQLSVCHVNHNIRGKEAQEDALWVGNFCRMRGLSVYAENVDVPKFSEENKCSIEEAARILRYQVLNNIADEKGFTSIAVAHNMEDNAETLLMNIMRGSGLDGLTGIKQKNGNIVRPLLSISRKDILEFAATHKLAFRTDSSNKNKKYLRNRVRLELLPALSKYNPEIVPALCRTTGLLERDAAYLNKIARDKFIQVSTEKDGALLLKLSDIKELDEALLTRVLLFAAKSALQEVSDAYISYKHINSVVELVKEGKTGTVLALPGQLKVKKDYDFLLLSNQPFEPKENKHLGEYVLPVPGRVVLPDGSILRASLFCGAKPKVAVRTKAVFPDYVARGGLLIRGRSAGDIFQPSGMQGKQKKLKKFFIDSKIPVEKRNHIPLVFDREGLLWIAGYRSSHRELRPITDSWLYLELIDKEYINV